MRCPDCNKFVSYDEPQAEISQVAVSGTEIQADIRVVLNCQDCGTELKDNEFNTQVEIEHECKPVEQREEEWKPDTDYKPDDSEKFEVENEGDPEGSGRVESKDRHGKPIKNSRYMKTFYGYTLEVGMKCRACGEMFGVHVKDEEQANGFNECC